MSTHTKRHAGDTKPPQQRHSEHMEAVRDVLRRSQYERVLAKIAFYEKWDRDGRAGSVQPMTSNEHDQLRFLRELRDALRAEMIAAGQLTADE